MFSTLRNRFGIPGVISVIALVFAMLGGAYAASDSSSGGKATASAKAKKGPRGPKGAPGPAGPQGPAGAAGAKGDAGANGANGLNGATGPTGPTGAKGATGATGPTGFSGFTKTLPSGETETGTWEYNDVTFTSFFPPVMDAISFSIPLAEAGENKAFVFTQEETENEEFGSSGCAGTLEKPIAPKGVLCVYTGIEEFFNASNFGVEARVPTTSGVGVVGGYGTTGAFLTGVLLEGGIILNGGGEERTIKEIIEASAQLQGTWAVTAP